MSFSKSPLAFEDIRAALDRALASPRGVVVRVESPGIAINLVTRANFFRRQDQKDNSKIYPDGHPHKNASVWDNLRIRAEGSTVKILKGDGTHLEIEEL
jgi:hypothetical protein